MECRVCIYRKVEAWIVVSGWVPLSLSYFLILTVEVVLGLGLLDSLPPATACVIISAKVIYKWT